MRSRGGEPAYPGQPDSLAPAWIRNPRPQPSTFNPQLFGAASPSSQRIPLAPRHLRRRRSGLRGKPLANPQIPLFCAGTRPSSATVGAVLSLNEPIAGPCNPAAPGGTGE